MVALQDLTFKEMLAGAIPDGYSYPVLLDVQAGGITGVWSNNDNTILLTDNDWTTESSSLTFTMTQEYVGKFQVEAHDEGWANVMGTASKQMDDLSIYITNVRSTWGKVTNSVDVELHNGNWISIDIDDENDQIHQHKFALRDGNITGEKINDDVRITLLSIMDADDYDAEPQGMEGLYAATQSGVGDTPFSRFELYGITADQNTDRWGLAGRSHSGKTEQGDLWIDDDDAPSWWISQNVSGGVLMEVKQGWWVKMNIMNENSAFFQPLAAAMSLDPRLSSEDFSGSDSDFTITIYGGGVIYADPDEEHGASGALGGPFYISTGTNGSAYAITEPADDEFRFRLISFGKGEDPYIDPANQCEDGYEWDETTQSCVPIGGGGGGSGGDDPFDIFDTQDAPFDEEDGVVERLLKTFTFGVNSTFRAFEAVVEGAMLALPAIIVIVAAVIAANLVVSATKTGTEKAKQLISKAGSMRQNMSIDIEGME